MDKNILVCYCRGNEFRVGRVLDQLGTRPECIFGDHKTPVIQQMKYEGEWVDDTVIEPFWWSENSTHTLEECANAIEQIEKNWHTNHNG